jgi:A/G-specific adenine glycosylase
MTDFSRVLRNWYSKKGRNLPWRETKNPYFIWLSEVILQQTRVEQGRPYYELFIENFPQVTDLANAKQDKVLRLWQGLGYYSRARNLHFAAKQILESHSGKFPSNYEEIKALKGIGDYTAAAIASFAFNLPHPVVDGNVYRFLSRYAGIHTPIDSTAGKKEFALLAEELLDRKYPGTHNQAMMEIGATICKPSNPLCGECPFVNSCYSFENGEIANLPVKEKKTKVRDRHFTYVIISDGKNVLLHQRGPKDIWQGLFEFPLIETQKLLTPKAILRQALYLDLTDAATIIEKVSTVIRHQLSHQSIHARFVHLKVDKLPMVTTNPDYQKVKLSALDTHAMPQLIVKYLGTESIL